MDFIVLLYIIVSVILCLLIYNILDKLYRRRPFFIVLQIVIIGITLNVVILMYNLFYFSKHKLKSGPKGPKGDTGPMGFQGELDNCPQCSNFSSTVGEEKIKEDSKKVLVSTPILPSGIKGNHL